jgi:hypothetical protein
LAPEVTHLDEEHSELLEVHAEGCETAHVRVAVAAFAPEQAPATSGPRSRLLSGLELLVAATAFAAALAIVVLLR